MRQSFVLTFSVAILVTVVFAIYSIETAAKPEVDRGAVATTSRASISTAQEAPIDRPTVTIGGTRVRVTLAESPEERARGLGGRSGLADGEGMLFIFPEEGIHGFWMKDMHFSIDIIWISKGGSVVHIAESVSPESYPASFLPENAARYVLEVPEGFTKAHNIAIGSVATLPR